MTALRPPESNWIAGALAPRSSLHSTDNVNAHFDGGEVYPSGILFKFSVRFRESASRAGQQQVYEQVNSFRDGRPGQGPVLRVLCEDSASEGFIQPPQGTSHLWRLGFWWSGEVQRRQLSATLTWPEQGINLRLGFTADEVGAALSESRLLWDLPEEGYRGF